MDGGPKQKRTLPDHVVAPEGTSLFRTINFERYVVSWQPNAPTILLCAGVAVSKMILLPQRPTPSMRLLSYFGTTAFVGFFVYMAYQKDAAQKTKLNKQAPKEIY